MKVNIKAIKRNIIWGIGAVLIWMWVAGFALFVVVILPSLVTVCDGWYGNEAYWYISLIPSWFLLTQIAILCFVSFKAFKLLGNMSH